jgi:hypothetical protein
MEILKNANPRSYATHANLDKALASMPPAWRYVVTYTADGRCTAIFQAGSLDGNMTAPIHFGFPVM